MSLDDLRGAAARLAARIHRRVDVVDEGNGMAAVIIRDEPTPSEKKWRPTVDLIINAHASFPTNSWETSGFYVMPQNFTEGGVPARNTGAIQLPNVGSCVRLSWNPPGFQAGTDFEPFYKLMLARLYTPSESP